VNSKNGEVTGGLKCRNEKVKGMSIKLNKCNLMAER